MNSNAVRNADRTRAAAAVRSSATATLPVAPTARGPAGGRSFMGRFLAGFTVKQLVDILELSWFDQMLVEASFHRAINVTLFSPTGDRIAASWRRVRRFHATRMQARIRSSSACRCLKTDVRLEGSRSCQTGRAFSWFVAWKEPLSCEREDLEAFCDWLVEAAAETPQPGQV